MAAADHVRLRRAQVPLTSSCSRLPSHAFLPCQASPCQVTSRPASYKCLPWSREAVFLPGFPLAANAIATAARGSCHPSCPSQLWAWEGCPSSAVAQPERWRLLPPQHPTVSPAVTAEAPPPSASPADSTITTSWAGRVTPAGWATCAFLTEPVPRPHSPLLPSPCPLLPSSRPPHLLFYIGDFKGNSSGTGHRDARGTGVGEAHVPMWGNPK